MNYTYKLIYDKHRKTYAVLSSSTISAFVSYLSNKDNYCT
jgi:hypothetical protein